MNDLIEKLKALRDEAHQDNLLAKGYNRGVARGKLAAYTRALELLQSAAPAEAQSVPRGVAKALREMIDAYKDILRRDGWCKETGLNAEDHALVIVSESALAAQRQASSGLSEEQAKRIVERCSQVAHEQQQLGASDVGWEVWQVVHELPALAGTQGKETK